VQAGRLLERRGAASEAAAPSAAVVRLTNLPGPERWPQLSPDGKTLAFVASSANASDEGDVFIQRVGGGNAINLTPDSPGNDTHPAFSPDGARIAFRSERDGGGLFVMGSTGESVRRLADFGYNPSWSPDGREIVVSTVTFDEVASRSGRGELWAIEVASGSKRRIETPGDAVQPRWSPRGHRIAFWSVSNAGQRDVFTVAASGGTVVPVTTDAAIDWDPVWSPDGRQLTFGSDRGGTMNLWRVPIDEASGTATGPPAPLSVPSGWAGHASLAADGRTLAYASRDVRTTLVRAPLDPARGRVSGPPAVVLRGSLELRDQALSPDGEWIAFTTGGREDVFVVRADGTGFRQLTDDAFRDRGPAWSPDGRRLAFYSNREGDYQAFTIERDGSGLKRVSEVPDGLTYLAWSPDGSELATCVGQDQGAWRIDLRQPVGAAAARRLPPIDGTHALCARSWSPDGTSLAGIAIDSAGVWRGVYVLALASGSYRRLGDQRGNEVLWLDAGRLVVGTGRGDIEVVDARSGEARLLARGQNPSVSRDGRWLTSLDRSEEADVWMATLP
jgi:Tol biopolymer transport system component